MIELISDNHQLLYKLGIALLVFSSILHIVCKPNLSPAEGEISALRFGWWLLVLTITIVSMAAYYSLVIVNYNNLILLMLFFFMIVVSIVEIRRIFSKKYSAGVKIVFTLLAILVFISGSLILAGIMGSKYNGT